MTAPFSQPLLPVRPTCSYYTLGGFSSFFHSLAFTLALVYYVSDVGLSPLRMILVGTVLEITLVLFEIPTGIVADLYSRRLSVVVGLVLIAGGLAVQGTFGTFGTIIAGQVAWGIGYTFISGADDAWITDEIGEDHVGLVFTRGQQVYLAATVLGTISAGGLGLVSLRLPFLVGGGGVLMLAAFLLTTMREDHFTPTPRQDRQTFSHLQHALSAGVAVARRRRVVRSFLLISLIVGLSSEAFDRLWTVRILRDFELPTVSGTADPAVWFTVFALISTTLALTTSLAVNHLSADRLHALHPNALLASLTVLQVLGILGLAVLGSLWLALAAMWVRDAAVALAQPVQAAWLNRNVDSRSRATVLSINGQADALGQVAGGPPLGALANRTSLTTALVVSGLVLSPAALVYLRLRPTAIDPDPEPVATAPDPSGPASANVSTVAKGPTARPGRTRLPDE